VSEAIGILLRVTSNHGDEGEAVENQDQQDLASREPKFCLTVCLYSQDVASTRNN
jgi:hypothetical protein